MCFHYALTSKAKTSKARFKPLKSDFNITHVNGFSHPKMPVILDNDKNNISMLQWGLIPEWIENNFKAKERTKTLNSRTETIFEKPSFKKSIKTKRCLVLAEGYYEYHFYKGKSYPYYINLKSKELFAFAGIWSSWINDSDKIINTYSILTTKANSLVSKIHNKPKVSQEARMPLILPKKYEMKWLENIEKEDIKSFFKPFSADLMQAQIIDRIGMMGKSNLLF